MRVLSVIALAFGSANAVSFVGFPSALSCLQADGSSQVKNAAELHTIVTENRATLIDRSAANVASGKCTSLSGVPLYAVSICLAIPRLLSQNSITSLEYCCLT